MDITTVFLDRDGVLNRLRRDYVTSWDTFDFLPRAKEALRLLSAAGMRIVVVTNQRAVARRLLGVADLEALHARMLSEIEQAGARVDAVYYCAHEKGQCTCRKPQVGMFLQAKRDFPAIDFDRSVMIGDALTDMEAGRRLGCRLILLTETGCSDGCADRRTGGNSTDGGHHDHAGDDADVRVSGESPADIAPNMPLDGTAPTLYEAVTRYLLPTSVSPVVG